MKLRKKHYTVTALTGLAGDIKITMRKNLNADAMFAAIRKDFAQIADHRANNKKVPLVDVLMSGFAMFSLKDQSLLALDGTGIYSSAKVSSPYCMKKVKRNGKVEYYQQMLGAAIVHPDQRAVLPLCPEMIIMQDGSTKQDCERKAAGRFLVKFRQDHPHLIFYQRTNPNRKLVRAGERL